MPKRKRNESCSRKAEATTASGQCSAAASFDVLPDEMLVQIFIKLDSVTRRNMESVCHRWKHILRDTKALTSHIKLDLAILPFNTPLHRPGAESDLASDTVCLLLTRNPGADTIEMTDETNRAIPRVQTRQQRPVERRWTLDYVLWHMGQMGSAGIDDDKWRIRRFRYFALIKLRMDMRDLIRTWTVSDQVDRLILHEVEVCDLSLRDVLRVTHRKPFIDVTLRRTVSCVIECAGQEDEEFECILMTAIGQNDEPLTAIEERQFGRVAQEVNLNRDDDAIAEIAKYLNEYSGGQQVTRAAVVDGSVLTHFWKRLVIAGKDVLAFINAEVDP